MTLNIAERGFGHQIRHFDIQDFEFRDDDATGFTFEGVASVVDSPYTVRDQFGEFTETIGTGAFNKTLRDSKADVALFINHDHQGIPLATRSAKTLQLAADPNLRVSAALDPMRSDVQNLRSAVTRGEMRQMSIGFTVPKDAKKDRWNDDMTERHITELNLIETSVVWRGANQHTTSAFRSWDELMESIVDCLATEDEIRRAIAAFEARLADTEPADPPADTFAERDRQDRERLERKRLLRPPQF
jgi:HK97 family phage prohead protease